MDLLTQQLNYTLGSASVDAFLLRSDRSGRAQCDPKHGWRREGDKCVRTPAQKRKLARNIAVGTAAPLGVAAITAGSALALYRSGKAEDLLRRSEQFVSEKLQVEDLDKEIDESRIPTPLKPMAKNLAGRTKRFIVEGYLRNSSAEQLSIDRLNGIATYRLRNGNMISVSSAGSKLLVFNSVQKGQHRGFPEYEVDFLVDNSYKRPEGGRKDKENAVILARKTKRMWEEQIRLMPDNALLKTRAYDEDDAGNKRSKIYKRIGFSEIQEIPGRY